jgi:hypothetical protein
MDHFEETKQQQSKENTAYTVTLFTDWKQYYFRWILFGFLSALLFSPVVTADAPYWTIKLWQCIFGIFFGFLSGVIFTFIQNTFNKQRTQNKTWIFIFLVWLGIKLLTQQPISVDEALGEGAASLFLLWLLLPRTSDKK